jgi:UDP:flavonoid glycosyltransferase YjiC (YdhE family)
MRVLISTTRGAGHIGPLLPFARALLRNNDDVIVTVVRAGARFVEDAGLDVWPIPDPPDEERLPVFDRARDLSEEEANRLVARDVFARIDARNALPGVTAAIQMWRPDVVLYESGELAAPIAAEKLGVPAVRVAIMVGAAEEFLLAAAADALDELRAQTGLPPDRGARRLLARPAFSLTPAMLEDPGSQARVARFREVRPEAAPLPDWWNGNQWPLVYLTLGSVAPQTEFFPGLYRAAIDALAVLPARILVTIGRDRDPAELGDVPPHVHVARWVPQDDVMPHAAAVVCHGGSGTVRGALAGGVPMAVVPLFADQPHNARRVEAIGAGIAVEAREIANLPGVVGRLLSEPGYRATARRAAAEVEALPSVDAAIEALRVYSQPRSVAWSTA